MEVDGRLELTLTIRLGVDELVHAVPLIDALQQLSIESTLGGLTRPSAPVAQAPAALALPLPPPATAQPEKRCPPHHYVYPSPTVAPGDTAVGVCKHCGRKKSGANVEELALVGDEQRRREGKKHRCKNCRELGHRAVTCKKAAA